ncbi:G-protein coupled receptor 52 [Procambarus clarkii]|uniref:G-protein coupled receptor 52 n=1 Tax=Procambarus clarkii TaxID=6728 RepID=UPI001E670094|nr:G-protein coupled receptor 52-like [Procambarus clarkii]
MFNRSGNVNCSHMFRDDNPPSWMNVFWQCMSLVLVGESVLTVYVIRRCPKMRQKTSTKLVTNLAVSGGLCGCLVFILTITRLMHRLREATVWCIIILPRYLHIVSVLCLSCLALDRYLAICWPLRYNDLLTDSRCKVLVLGCWAVPVLTFIVLLPSTKFSCFHPSPFLTGYLTVFTVASLAVVLMYVLMAREFRRRRHEMEHANKTMEEDNRRIRVKTAIDVLIIVFLKLLLAVPDVIVNLLRVVQVIEWDYTYVFAPLLMLLHEMICLPLISWRNADFRAALYSSCRTFRKTCCPRHAAKAPSDSDSSKNIKLVTRDSQISNNVSQVTQASELSKDIFQTAQESHLSDTIS